MSFFRNYAIILLLIISATQSLFCDSLPPYSVIENEAHHPILTPSFSGRKTLKIRLNNGLEAYLISDPEVDLSSAALVVKTGSWDDPTDHSGMAHFLEHMLFLGTKKYPKESEYSQFINEHGGVYNAFTKNDSTAYMFTVKHNAFPEALDRFVNFFIDPLFNPSGVSRELNAIDQEYAKNIENDSIRQYYVLKALTNPSHPGHAFGMGNYDALVNVSQDTLKNWYKEHYSANIMRLVVTSSLPIDELKTLVVSEFSNIPDLHLEPTDSKSPMISKDVLGHMVYIEPVKDIRSLTLFWELPPQFVDMKDTKPEQLVGYVLGHEGKEGLLSHLKEQKLANELSAGGQIIGGHNALFYIDIDLTDLGVKKVNNVINDVFEALANFKKEGIPHYLFEESQQIAAIDYQYQVRKDSFEQAANDARALAHEDIATYPEQTFFIKKHDAKNTQALLDFLTPDNCVFNLTAPEKLTGIKTDQVEKWLGVHYRIEPISAEMLLKWKQAKPHSHITLPEINSFIPSKLTLLHPAESYATKSSSLNLPHPNLIVNSDFANIYYSTDLTYAIPKTFWSFEIKTPMIHADAAESLVLGDLYVRNILALLCPYAYEASVAGLSFHLSRTDNGVLFTIEGYNDKAEILFAKIIKNLKNPPIKEQQFKTFKESLTRDYQNAGLNQPLQQASESFANLIYANYVTEQQKAIAIKKITFESFEIFLSTLFNQVYIEGMLYGNITEQEAKKISNDLITIIDAKPYSKADHYKKQLVMLPEGGPFYFETKSKSQGNAVILAVESEPFSFKNRAAQQILMQAMKEPFFSALRTKQQTCYLVHSKSEELEKHLFDMFAVQSTTHDGRDLLARFELFIEDFMQEITKENVTQQRFENIQHSLLVNMLQPPKDIASMGILLNKLAFVYDGDFEWISKRIQGIKELTYIDFLNIATETMSPQNKARLAIIVNGVTPEPYILHYKKITTPAQFRKTLSKPL